MTDPIPVNTNRLAVALGYLLHPYMLSAVSLYAVLQGLTFQTALGWMTMLLSILIIPSLILIARARRQGKYVYQRQTRTPIYLMGWLSILISIGLIIVGNGSQNLLACFLALAVWLPLQLAVNTYYTKISGHAAVSAGCMTGLLMLGTLDTPALKLIALSVVLITSWARMVTKHHTFEQIALGWLVASLSVIITFALVL